MTLHGVAGWTEPERVKVISDFEAGWVKLVFRASDQGARFLGLLLRMLAICHVNLVEARQVAADCFTQWEVVNEVSQASAANSLPNNLDAAPIRTQLIDLVRGVPFLHG